jgi:hypothetical protein
MTDIFQLLFFNTRRARRLFSPPRTSKRIRYFSGPAVDRANFQPEGLEFGCIKGRLTGASFEEPDQPFEAIDAIFQSIEEATLERVF